MGTFSLWHWVIVLVIVMLIFGTKKLRNVGQDLGGAVKGFKEGMKESSTENKPADATTPSPAQELGGAQTGQTIEGEVKEKTRS